MAAVVEVLPVLDISDLAAARAQMLQMREAMPAFEPPASLDITKRSIPGPAGDPDVEITVIRPRGAAAEGPGGAAEGPGGAAEGPGGAAERPGLLWIHGGGFVLGDVEGDMPVAAGLAEGAGAVVVSVEYRLAPEHPFPAPVEDCYAALTWTAEHAAELGIDPGRLAVGGLSAGGGLAAAVALMARDRGGPALCFQLLDIPEVDDRLSTPSMKQFTDTPLWHHPNAILSWEAYLGPGHNGDTSPYAAPARATDLSGLPPAYVVTCEFDPLRDEGIEYAQRLMQAGVPTELHHFPGTFHGSSGAGAGTAISERMVAERTEALRRALHK
ncbi:alpha/beta hydrolase [Paractinoplanes rhizophilus]|uniref:Alpha/beta hydrolase n=1 Tax=Paractinoplanes rhizophilus TaxID=1416877 RepID=A0ABW2I504_9ACTN